MSSSRSQSVSVPPMDGHNQALVANVHPPRWVNPQPVPRYNLVVVGAGPAGLVAASGAAGLGAKVALIEKRLLGGDCLNVGCVPSKAIIRSSRVAVEVREAGRFGVQVPDGTEVDFPAVMERMRRLRAQVSLHDSAQQLQSQGVDLFFGEPRFIGPDAVGVEGSRLRFARALISTGARAAELPIPGLAQAGYLTNETVFDLTERPTRLACIGAGPIGCELAQAFQRLGSDVTLLEAGPRILGREDPDAATILQRALEQDGVRLLLGCNILRVELQGKEKRIHYRLESQEKPALSPSTGSGRGGIEGLVVVDQILLGVGRLPNVESLNLEAAEVRYDPKQGVQVDDFLRTTNPRIYAAGDVCMRLKFTHAADAAARLVIENALFFGRKRLSHLNIPWCTYTDPEIAHVGVYEEAQKAGISVATLLKRFSDVDRAVVDGEEEGFVKVHLRKGTDRILGATIVARHAGEMIGEICLAMARGIGLGALSKVVHPYPTQAQAIPQVADAYQAGRLTRGLKRILTRWFAFRRMG